MARVAILTGFEPYGGRGINPAAEVVKRLDGSTVTGARVVGRLLPVSYAKLGSSIEALLREHEASAIVSLGLWPGEKMIRLERVAINVADFEIADNEGTFLTDAAIQGNAATALMATWPVRAAERALIDAGIPARVSSTAGTFLCNATLFQFLHQLEGRRRRVPCGFVHLPYLPAQVAELMRDLHRERQLELEQRADVASMDLDTMARAVRIVIETCLTLPPAP